MQEVRIMKVWPLAMGVGVAAGAVTVAMLPRQSKAKKLVNQAAHKVEDVVYNVVDKMTDEMGM
jgi:hypothetical protein